MCLRAVCVLCVCALFIIMPKYITDQFSSVLLTSWVLFSSSCLCVF